MQKKALVYVSDSCLPQVMSCLKEAGCRLTVVEGAEEGRVNLSGYRYDLVVFEHQETLDFEYAMQDIRSRTDAPVLVLVNRTDYEAVEPYLVLADDVLMVNFDPTEFVVRTRALTKHSRVTLHQDNNCLCFGELRVFPHKMVLVRNKRPVKLTPTEYKILVLMGTHPGQVFSQSQIHAAVRDDLIEINVDKTISNHISSLKRKLARISLAQYIHVEKSMGYHFLYQNAQGIHDDIYEEIT